MISDFMIQMSTTENQTLHFSDITLYPEDYNLSGSNPVKDD